jgi:hypothetical protein
MIRNTSAKGWPMALRPGPSSQRFGYWIHQGYLEFFVDRNDGVVTELPTSGYVLIVDGQAKPDRL